VFADTENNDSATTRGTATHRFLQLLDLNQNCDVNNLSQQLEALVEGRYLSAAESAMIDLEAAAWFFHTELGRRVREFAAQVLRETTFVGRIIPEEFDTDVQQRDAQDVILIRGMVDLMLPTGCGWEIVDYKTDAVSGDACVRRAESYRTQMDLYGRAVQAIYRRPIAHRWLVFLHARQVIHLESAGD
jgi:ATP-dependent helicase/nuclease subunit A